MADEYFVRVSTVMFRKWMDALKRPIRIDHQLPLALFRPRCGAIA